MFEGMTRHWWVSASGALRKRPVVVGHRRQARFNNKLRSTAAAHGNGWASLFELLLLPHNNNDAAGCHLRCCWLTVSAWRVTVACSAHNSPSASNCGALALHSPA